MLQLSFAGTEYNSGWVKQKGTPHQPTQLTLQQPSGKYLQHPSADKEIKRNNASIQDAFVLLSSIFWAMIAAVADSPYPSESTAQLLFEDEGVISAVTVGDHLTPFNLVAFNRSSLIMKKLNSDEDAKVCDTGRRKARVSGSLRACSVGVMS